MQGKSTLSPYMPHGHCFLWEPEIVLLHVGSDLLIGVSYLSIPMALLYYVWKRQDLHYPYIILLFSAFITSCGFTHLFEIYTTWVPAYWEEGILKLITGVISMTTAIALWPMIPKALAIPSLREMELKNFALEQEVNRRKRIEAELRNQEARLEQIVLERTLELKQINEELALKNAQLMDISTHDPLTGVLNRRGFSIQAQTLIAHARRHGNRMFLMFFDIDDMKSINDQYGHAAGDDAIVRLATVLENTFRSTDVIARIGGDEFIVLAIESGEINHDSIDMRLREMKEELSMTQKLSFVLQFSYGMSLIDAKEDVDLEELLHHADQLMYEKKRRNSEK